MRLEPRPRRLIVAIPGALVGVAWTSVALVNWPAPGTNCGSLLSAWSTPTSEVCVRTLLDTVTIGLSELKSRRTMREPVTVTSWS